MTVFTATRSPAQRSRFLPAGIAGLAVGIAAALGAVHAGTPVQVPAMGQMAGSNAIDPAKRVPGAIEVSKIDFKRGNGGAGRLVIQFTGNGASPDLRTQGSQVIVNVANAQLPAELQRQIDVTDFATPVQSISPRGSGSGTQLVLQTQGNVESMAYQTGNEYIVEIVPRAQAAKTVSPASPAMGQMSAAAAPARSYAGRPVTFNFQDVPVRTVLQLIAEESNLNIVASDTVLGNVTLRLVNVPWDQALDIVLQAKGLDKRRSGNVMWVAPQSEIAKYEQDREDARIALDNRVDMVTEYIQINYHNAAQILKALSEAKGIGSGAGGGAGGAGGGGAGGGGAGEGGFLSPRGRMVADERTNTLMVSDIPKKIAEMKNLIRIIDRPVDQVIIEARVVIANESFARELGARFGVTGTSNSGRIGYGDTIDRNTTNQNIVNGATPGSPLQKGLLSNLGVAGAAGSVAVSILNAGYALDVELSAMQTQGRGEVISNPRVVTSNQREAVISQGQEVGYVTIQPATAGGVATPSVQFKDVLLEMRVTPTITNDGRVFLNMNVKKDEISGFIDTSIGDVPQINKRSINTAVLVEDGQTVVIGGVYEFRDRNDLRKVPFLADIPVLGNLFKNRVKGQDKAELLIMVTPRIMQVAQR